MVGTSGMSGQRVSPVTARQRSVPALMCGAAGGSEPELSCAVPLSSACKRVAAALEHDVFELRQLLANFEHFELDLRRGADRRRRAHCICPDLARASATNSFIVLAGSSDLHHESVRRGGELADADEILQRIVGDLVVEAGIDRIGVGREQDRVAVRRPSARRCPCRYCRRRRRCFR